MTAQIKYDNTNTHTRIHYPNMWRVNHQYTTVLWDLCLCVWGKNDKVMHSENRERGAWWERGPSVWWRQKRNGQREIKGGEWETERDIKWEVTCRVKLIGRKRRFITFGFLVWGVVSTENAAGSKHREIQLQTCHDATQNRAQIECFTVCGLY